MPSCCLEKLDLSVKFSFSLISAIDIQCFDTVGWAIEKARNMSNLPHLSQRFSMEAQNSKPETRSSNSTWSNCRMAVNGPTLFPGRRSYEATKPGLF